MWFSRTKRTVSLSSAGVKYTLIVEKVKDLSFARQMLTSMRPGVQLEKLTVDEDTTGENHLAKKLMGSARSNHIDTRHDFIRDAILKGDIRIAHVDTQVQHADILTKNPNSEELKKIGDK